MTKIVPVPGKGEKEKISRNHERAKPRKKILTNFVHTIWYQRFEKNKMITIDFNEGIK